MDSVPANSIESLLPIAVAQQVDMSVVVGPFLTVTVPSAQIVGLLRTVESHAGDSGVAIARCLLGGQPKYMASLSGGISDVELGRRMKANPLLAEALSTCEQIGIACTLEAELHRRAMAGVDDRGSMRALEMALKARRSDYRERTQVEQTVTLRAAEASGAYVSDWRAANPIDQPPGA